MANPEHLELLRQGVEVWNKWYVQQWRKDQLFASDLSYADLCGTDIRGDLLSRARFIGTILPNLEPREDIWPTDPARLFVALKMARTSLRCCAGVSRRRS